MRYLLATIALLSASVASADVNVAAAISLKESLTEIAAAYAKLGGNQVHFTFGGSGELAAQIEQGAPIDLFISAAQDQVDDLDKAGVADGTSRIVIARNTLVLIVPAGVSDGPGNFDDLADRKRSPRIAIGHPRTVPAGKYAQQVLEHFRANDTARLMYANNVRQVLDWVERGEVSAGLVYATDARIAGDKVRVIATADAKLHSPIEYPAVIIKDSKNSEAAKRFLEFLRGEESQRIFRTRGFADR